MVIASLGSVLAPLAFLACPIGMGMMMWVMARASKKSDRESATARSDQPPSLEALQDEQRRLNEQIDRLERAEANGARAPVDAK